MVTLYHGKCKDCGFFREEEPHPEGQGFWGICTICGEDHWSESFCQEEADSFEWEERE